MDRTDYTTLTQIDRLATWRGILAREQRIAAQLDATRSAKRSDLLNLGSYDIEAVREFIATNVR